MGSIKFSGLVTGIWGKLNGSVFVRNRSCAVIKNKQTPHNPQRLYQGFNRSNFNYLSRHWKDLTQAQRDDWNSLSLTVSIYNHWGDKYNPSGFNLFCRLNHNLFLCNRPLIDDAPVSSSVVPLSSFSVAEIIEGWENMFIQFAGQTTDPDTIHIVYASPCVSQGISYNKANFKVVSLIPAGTDSAYDVWDGYINIFPIPRATRKIFFKLRAINKNTGFDSIIGIASTIVVASAEHPGIGDMSIGFDFEIY